MATYIARRLIHAVVVLVIVSIMVFLIMRLLPGDPLLIYIAQSAELQAMSPEMLQELRHEFGLDRPLVLQYLSWIWGVLHGDLGTSIYYREDVGKLLLERYPVTLHLGLLALAVGAVFGILAGMLAAVKRGTWADKLITPLSYMGITIPVFWLGILLIYLFGLKLRWLPIAGYTSPFENFWLSTKQAIMPVLCMSVFGLAANARQMRSSMLEVISQDYIRTAWSKGLSGRVVVLKHALKNSLIPVITLMGMGVGITFTG
ncbi:MAG: ABC transporter permease, partial [Moorellales bacterium]